MYRLKFKAIPSFKFIIGKDFIVQMFRESRKNLPYKCYVLYIPIILRVQFFYYLCIEYWQAFDQQQPLDINQINRVLKK